MGGGWSALLLSSVPSTVIVLLAVVLISPPSSHSYNELTKPLGVNQGLHPNNTSADYTPNADTFFLFDGIYDVKQEFVTLVNQSRIYLDHLVDYRENAGIRHISTSPSYICSIFRNISKIIIYTQPSNSPANM